MVMNKIHVEVAYAQPEIQKIITLDVEVNSTIEEVIIQSGIMTIFPEIDLQRQKIGVFSKPRHLTDIVNEGDRIEIYRQLTIDPKEARRAKAKKNAKKGSGLTR